jgi:hypothetical protein
LTSIQTQQKRGKNPKKVIISIHIENTWEARVMRRFCQWQLRDKRPDLKKRRHLPNQFSARQRICLNTGIQKLSFRQSTHDTKKVILNNLYLWVLTKKYLLLTQSLATNHRYCTLQGQVNTLLIVKCSQVQKARFHQISTFW